MVQREWVEKDFYKVLGVSSDASEDEIKRVARKLLAENHPDRNPDDKAADERAESEVLAEYLPAQLDDSELAGIVTAAIAEAGVADPKAMGKVMKLVNPKVAGRAEGSRVAAEVKRQLSGS